MSTQPTAYEINQMKKDIADIGHRIWARGFCAGNEGNHSIRIGPDRVLCTPTGVSKGFLGPDDVIVCDMDGKQVEPNKNGRRPTSEVKVHLAIYRHRPDIRAVVHSHPPHAVAFCVAQVPLPEGIHPEAEVFLGKVPIAKYATPSTHDLPNSILPLIGPDTSTVLMGNHGSVSFADTLLNAYYVLEILDNYCKVLLLARGLGRINQLTSEEMVELLKVKEKFGFKDSRLACAASGCIGEQNQPFFATFEQTASATCGCGSSRVDPIASAVTALAPSAGSAVDEATFEAMVQAITDQIMAAAR